MRKRAASNSARDSFVELADRIVSCRRCPRLRRYCLEIAAKRRRAFADQEYWVLPVPGFGDRQAELLIVGLAPAAHGANRTGRLFTGDRSGDFLYSALHRAGFANHPLSVNRHDGLKLKGAYISAVLRCAPPDNKPARREVERCRSFLEEELRLLERLKAILALGRLAFDICLDILSKQVDFKKSRYIFRHGAIYSISPCLPLLAASYHPSQQNTFPGKLTSEMFDRVLEGIKLRITASPR